MAGGMAKNLDDLMPAIADQGMPNLCGAFAQGVSVQIMPGYVSTGDVTITFATEGLGDMYDGNYVVLVQNQTDAADEALITSKLGKSFAIAGPDSDDVLDIVIIGRLKTQLA